MNKNRFKITLLAASSYSARILTRLIESFGHEVVVVALETGPRPEPESVQPLCDIVLVETSDDSDSGFNAAATARLENSKIPIVSVSPDPGMDHMVRCFACGIDGHIDSNSPAAEFERMIIWFIDKKGKMNAAAEKMRMSPNFKKS